MTTFEALDRLRDGFEGTAFRPQARCPVCGADSDVYDRATNIHPEHRIQFDLRVCKSCAHGWIDPLPVQALLSHLYGRGSHSVMGVDLQPKRALSPPERLVQQAAAGLKPGRYLEIGVGSGLLYRAFVEGGWATAGVEPAGCGVGLPGVVRSVEQIPAASRFDLIVAMDVLEHIADPLTQVSELRRLAAPNSRFFAAFPHRRSLRAWWMKGRWRMVRPLGHLHFFSRGSARLLLQQAGYRLDEVTSTDLMELRQVCGPRSALLFAGQCLGLGDQLVVFATATPASQ